ncbi:MAG: hypothetical protein EB015_19340 [Methylocystaceae bacterium]|nr:hypothetical protein [Methylocystaceae bacterium]
MDQKRPFIFGSLQLCYEVNPKLWNVFCALTNRPIGQPNYNWTEHDVIIFILARGLAKHDAGNSENSNEEPGPVSDGFGYNIRRDNATSNCMATRRLSDSDDSCLFIIGAP